MAFDPKKFGAIPVEEFDPEKYGAVSVESNQNIQDKPQIQHQSIESLKAQQNLAEKEANKGMLGRFVKELPGATLNTVLGAPAKFLISAAEVPETFIKGKATQRTYNIPGLKPFKSHISEAETRAGQIIEGEKPLYTALTPFAEVPMAAMETVGVFKGAKTLNNVRNNTKIWNLIQPKLTSLEQSEAVKSGQIFKTLTGKIKQTPDPEMINATRSYLKTTEPIKATGQLQVGIAKEANMLRGGLRQSKAIWNKNELIGAINKIEKPHLLSGDVEKAFTKTLQATLKESEKSSKTLEGLLDVRQKFDRIVAKQYPKLYESDTLSPIKIAVKETRRAINKLIEAKLPDTAQKAEFINSLRKQSLLYDAIDNVATKVPKVGSTALSRWAKSHTGLIKGLKWGITGASAGLGIKSLQDLGE